MWWCKLVFKFHSCSSTSERWYLLISQKDLCSAHGKWSCLCCEDWGQAPSSCFAVKNHNLPCPCRIWHPVPSGWVHAVQETRDVTVTMRKHSKLFAIPSVYSQTSVISPCPTQITLESPSITALYRRAEQRIDRASKRGSQAALAVTTQPPPCSKVPPRADAATSGEYTGDRAVQTHTHTLWQRKSCPKLFSIIDLLFNWTSWLTNIAHYFTH